MIVAQHGTRASESVSFFGLGRPGDTKRPAVERDDKTGRWFRDASVVYISDALATSINGWHLLIAARWLVALDFDHEKQWFLGEVEPLGGYARIKGVLIEGCGPAHSWRGHGMPASLATIPHSLIEAAVARVMETT